MSWIQRILEQLDNIEEFDLIVPQAAATDKETVVGVADNTLKRLFTYRLQLMQQSKRLEAEMIGAKTEDIDGLSQQYIALNGQIGAVDDLLWASVRQDFNLWGKPAIGLRSDWKVVWFEQPDPLDGLSSILRHFDLGGFRGPGGGGGGAEGGPGEGAGAQTA
jgi:hypothetical protein